MFHSNIAMRKRQRPRYSNTENLSGLIPQEYRVQGWIGGRSVTRNVMARSEREAIFMGMQIFSTNSEISVAKV